MLVDREVHALICEGCGKLLYVDILMVFPPGLEASPLRFYCRPECNPIVTGKGIEMPPGQTRGRPWYAGKEAPDANR